MPPFPKGGLFHRCPEQDRCAGNREAGSGGAIRRRGGHSGRIRASLRVGDALRRVAMPVAQDVSPRLIPLVVSLVPRILLGFSHYLRVSDPRAAGVPSGQGGRTDRASLQRGWRRREQCEPRHGPCRAYGGGRTAFGRGCIRVALRILSSRSAGGYAQLGISLGAVARQCLCIAAFPGCVSCSQCSLCCISALGRGVAPAMPVAGRASIRCGGGCTGWYGRRRGCAVRDVRGVASAIVAAVDVPDSSRL